MKLSQKTCLWKAHIWFFGLRNNMSLGAAEDAAL